MFQFFYLLLIEQQKQRLKFTDMGFFFPGHILEYGLYFGIIGQRGQLLIKVDRVQLRDNCPRRSSISRFSFLTLLKSNGTVEIILLLLHLKAQV